MSGPRRRRRGSPHRPLAGLALAAFVLGASAPALAQGRTAAPPAGVPAESRPDVLEGVGIDQNLGATIPLDLEFRDSTGAAIRLSERFGDRPVVLALVYYRCPMLCTQVLGGLVSALGVLAFDAGGEFDVIAVSIDPRETPAVAAAKKDSVLERYGPRGRAEGWSFLTGEEEAIRSLADAVGFRYAWDDSQQQFAHAAGIMVLTPDGRLARYFYGIEYSPRDLRFALVEAAGGRIGNPVDRLLLYCYHYDPATGRYGLVTMSLVRLGGVATLAALGIFVAVSLLRDRRGRGRREGRAAPSGTGGR